MLRLDLAIQRVNRIENDFVTADDPQRWRNLGMTPPVVAPARLASKPLRRIETQFMNLAAHRASPPRSAHQDFAHQIDIVIFAHLLDPPGGIEVEVKVIAIRVGLTVSGHRV